MGEHSPVDALVPSIVCEWAVGGGVGPDSVEEEGSEPCSNPALYWDLGKSLGGKCLGSDETEGGRGWKRLPFVTDSHIVKACTTAEKVAIALIKDSDDSGFWFTLYGADWIKDVGSSLSFLSLPLPPPLIPILPFFATKPNYLRTPTSKWHSNSPGTQPAITHSQLPTKRLSPACSSADGRRL